MAYGVTSTGFKAKRYEEIFDDIKTRFRTDLGIDLDRNPDMIAKVISNIITLPIAQSWSNTQTLQSMFDVDKAEGIWLDNLASFYGITRSLGSYARGRLTITAYPPVTIMPEEKFTSTGGDAFLNDDAIVVSEASATKVVYKTTIDNPLLRENVIQIDSTTYSAVGSNPNNVSLGVLTELINDDANRNVLATLVEADGEFTLTLESKTLYERHTFHKGNTFTLAEVVSHGEVRSDKLGDFVYAEGTVTTAPAYSSIISVVNLEPIDNGAGEETDAELRQRIKTTRSTGKATVASIRAGILAVENVNAAIVLENDTEYQDVVNNIPPKAFKCIVRGGTAVDIAEAIWDTKPAGISSTGSEMVIIRDSENEEQAVYFSRVADRYIHVEVSYSLYSEEDAPTDVEEAIAAQVLTFGGSLGVGVDVIQGRIMSAIYQNVTGLERVIVKIGVTSAPTDPTPFLDATYPIQVSLSEEANFALNRINVTTI